MKKLTMFAAVVAFCCTTYADLAWDLQAKAPGGVFVQGEELRFGFREKTQGATENWIARNEAGVIVAEGGWNGLGELVLAPLPDGYYLLEIVGREGKKSFAVLPDFSKNPPPADEFFSCDTAQSWVAHPDRGNKRSPKNSFEVVSEVSHRCGLRMVRERMSWGQCEANPGEYGWHQYRTNADLLKERGIKVCGMFHDAPQWAKKKNGKLPVDLLAVYRFCKKAAEEFAGEMDAWEFWNEQDIGFTVESAWDYASTMKAAYLGFKAANAKIPVAIGAYAKSSSIEPYGDASMKSGLADYFDIFNYHVYRSVPDYWKLTVPEIRRHMAAFGIEGKTTWITESGVVTEGTGKVDSYIKGVRAHSWEQELEQADHLQKMAIAQQFAGTDRTFYFVMPPYNELGGNKDWGLLRRDYSAKPGIAALATMCGKLGNAKLLGKVNLGEKVNAYLYQNRTDGSQSLAYWTDAPVSPVLPNADKLKGVSWLGTPFSAENGKLPPTKYLKIVDLPKECKPSVAEVPWEAPASKPAAAMEKAVVLRVELPEDTALIDEKSKVDLKKDGAVRIKVQVWNLSLTAKSGTITGKGGVFAGLPKHVDVPSMGMEEFMVDFTPNGDKLQSGEMTLLGYFGGLPISPLVMPYGNSVKMKALAKSSELATANTAKNWNANTSGKSEIAQDGESVRVKTTFPPNVDRWVYPKLKLEPPVNDVFAISFDFKCDKPDKLRQTGTYLKNYHNTGTPADGDWHEIFILAAPGETGKLENLQIGLNSLCDEVTYWFRNVKIYQL